MRKIPGFCLKHRLIYLESSIFDSFSGSLASDTRGTWTVLIGQILLNYFIGGVQFGSNKE